MGTSPSFNILVASFTDSIYTLEFNPGTPGPTPTLRYISQVVVGRSPTWIEAHPSDRSLIFACPRLEKGQDGQIVAVKYDKNSGKGEKIDEATCSSEGTDPCSLLVTEDEIVVANYSGGTVASIPVSTTPPYTRPAAVWKVALPFDAEQLGRNLSRQDGSHPHQAILNTLNTTEQELLVPDLGSDKVWRFTKASDGYWAIRDFISVKTGGGPRHIAIYGTTLYILSELTSELAVYKVHTGNVPTHVVTLSTVKASPPPNGMNAAEVLIPKPNRSFPTAYIYASNRDDPHPDGDTIAIFSLEKGEERPELVTEVRTGLRHLRGMAFGGEDDRWLVVGGVGSRAASLEGGGVKIYERIEGGKGLRQVAKLDHDVGRQMRATMFLWL